MGGATKWAATLDRLKACGVDGVITIVNQTDELGTLHRIVERLRQLGELVPS